MKKYIFSKDTLLATIFTFIVLGLLGLLVINISAFNPFVKAFKDFDFMNIYYSKIRTHQGTLDTNIVVVNVGHLKRDSIGLMLQKINEQSPKIIGFDIFIAEQKEKTSDSVLKQALEQTSCLVVASDINGNGMAQYFGKYAKGYINFNGENSSSTTRSFCPFTDKKGNTDTSFTARILSFADTDKFKNLTVRKNQTEFIHFRGGHDKFRTYTPAEIFDTNSDLSLLKDKIILMGYAGSSFGEVVDLEDAHFTPMNPEVSGKSYPDMYGVYIHANILSIMLADDYIKIMSPWLAWVLAFILCYLHMIIFAFYFNEKTKWMHLVAKIIQLTTSVFLLWIEFLVFQYFNYKIDMLPAIVAIILSVDILYFYEGIIAYLKKKTKIKSHFSKH